MNKKGFGAVELVVSLSISIVALGVFAGVVLWTGRNLDFWITHFKGHAVHVPLWLAAVITIIGNGFILAVDVIGEVARYLI